MFVKPEAKNNFLLPGR